jgi:plasmid stabilization system protein ParE
VKYTEAHSPSSSGAPATDPRPGVSDEGPCPLFWPEQEQHGVRYVPLQAELSEELESLQPRLRELAAVGDALRSLQTREGTPLSVDAVDALAARTGEMLVEIAAHMDGEPAEITRMRAAAFLEGGSHAEAAIREGGLYESAPLTVLCGPQCTWRLKTPAPLHTVVAAAGNARYDELVRALDDAAGDAAARLREELGLAELHLDFSYPMRVTDMIACGGEANAYPKHFAYFLPEDEAVPGVPGQRKKTIVFRNAYRDRYEVISRPLGEAIFDGPRGDANVPVEGALLAWFRGHDIGHSAALPSTDYRWRLDLGHEPFMMIQEALADVYGLLLALTPTWLSLSGLSPVDVADTFLGELLHYLRRGPWLYGDAGAAYLELSYLATNDFLQIAADGRVTWDPERLHEGIRALARELAETVLAPRDARPCAQLVARYGWPAQTPAAIVLGELQGDLRRIPSALAYGEAPATVAA